MTGDGVHFRQGTRHDLPALEQLYPLAFPDEDLLPLLRQLVDDRSDVVSLIAEAAGELVAHAAFSDCAVEGMREHVALLGPAAVHPEWQQKGVGSKLIRAGIAHMRDAGFARIMVLGDPAYYSRFGFTADEEVKPPYRLPDDWLTAWQSVRLTGVPVNGTLIVPEPWQPRELWLP